MAEAYQRRSTLPAMVHDRPKRRQRHALARLGLGFLMLLGAGACKQTPFEGRDPGDCSDRADNDVDGLYDCDDEGCLGAPDCLEADDPTPAPDPIRQGVFQLGPEVICANPVAGIDRLEEVSLQRGIDQVVFDPTSGTDVEDIGATTGRGGAVLAADLDGDGDLDLMQGPTTIYVNDGQAHFTATDGPLPMGTIGSATYLGAYDLDGDGLPELIGDWEADGTNSMRLWRNLGSLTFSEAEFFDVPDSVQTAINASIALGDPDGDGDMDLLYITGAYYGDDGNLVFPPGLMYQNVDGSFELWFEMPGHPSSQVALFTDRDNDGDQDLYVPNDWPHEGAPSVFWRNDGVDADGKPTLVDDAQSLGANLEMAAMGIDSADLNADGRLDYCITDVGRPLCLVSQPDGSYAEGGSALGLYPDIKGGNDFLSTVGWSIDFADMDNDGWVETLQASAPDSVAVENDLYEVADLLWRGLPDGTFEDVSEAVGFADLTDHLGLVTADLDGDGWLEVFTAGRGSVPRLYANRCGSESWLEVLLQGPPENRRGFGARMELTWSGGTQVRELTGLRATSQGPPRVHFGLGQDEEAMRLEIQWPDGEISIYEALPARRMVTAVHSSIADDEKDPGDDDDSASDIADDEKDLGDDDDSASDDAGGQ